MASILKLDSGRWRAQVRKRGAPSQSKTFRTKAMAERWAREREQEVDLGFISTGSAQRTLMRDLIAQYGRDITPNKRGSTQEQSRLRLLSMAFYDITLYQLTPKTIMDFVASRREVVGSDTIRRDLSVLSSVVEVARSQWGHQILDNPVQSVLRSVNRQKLLRRRVERDRRLAPGEYRRLLSASHPVMRQLIRLAIETAMRRKELANVRKAHLRHDGLLIPDDKTDRSVVIPISRRARRIIDRLGGKGFAMRPDSITQCFSRACVRAGIEDLRVHDLRHEATSRLFDKGLSVAEVAMITRHASWGSLKTYTHLTRARVADKLG